MIAHLRPHRPRRAACAIQAHAYVEAAFSRIAGLRDEPPPTGAPSLPTRFLRHADEQTVVAVRAVLEASTLLPEPVAAARCGVVAAPCQAGRIATARSLALLQTGGAVTVSPHIVPHCSLHSVAGAVSVAFGMHGPHVGIGGGPDALSEGLFTALSLIDSGMPDPCDAVWLLVSDWESEPELDSHGEPLGEPVCRALAMLLAPEAAAAGTEPRIALVTPAGQWPADPPDEPDVDLAAFARAIDMCRSGMALASWAVNCPWGGRVRVEAGTESLVSSRREAA
ncbi:MAG: hypothetical protein ACKO4Z_12435 [Planctomycetota bacterium]